MLAAFRWKLAPLELHFPGCWRFPYLQHDLRLGRSAPPGDWNACAPSAPAEVSFSPHFVGEAACFGVAGALLGLPLAALCATGAVRFDGRHCGIAICQHSRPGTTELSAASVLLALAVGWESRCILLFTRARGFPGFAR